MKKSILIIIFIIFLFKSSFSQFGNFKGREYHRKILSINSSIINSTFIENASIFNNLELSAYTPLTFSRIFSNQLYGLGIGNYFPYYTNEKNIFYTKASVDFVFGEASNFTAGLFIEYLFVKNKINTGIRFSYPLRLYTLNKYSFDLGIRTDISYNTLLSQWILGLSLGVNMNKITHTNYRKPVVYIYTQDTIDLFVSLDFKGDFTFTWPKYNNGWDLKVYPNSKIKNLNDNKTYDYLFWEGTYLKPKKDTISTGYIIKKEELSEFLVEKLEYIGMNDREINDFITYWVPLLTKKKYLINFIQNENCNMIANYTFSKKPETFIRLIVIFSETNKEIIKKQNLIKNKRKGFTVVEWGGIEI